MSFRYKHSLKEQAIDIPPQVCITRDNVQVSVDGVLYLKVLNPERASYGIADYVFGITQLAQTTLRSEFGRLSSTGPSRNRRTSIPKWSASWIRPRIRGASRLCATRSKISPHRRTFCRYGKANARRAREARADLTSEGQRDAAINTAEGEKQQAIKASEGKKQQQINGGEGEAVAILAIGKATPRHSNRSPRHPRPGVFEAEQLRFSENFLTEFGKLDKPATADFTGNAQRRRLDDLAWR